MIRFTSQLSVADCYHPCVIFFVCVHMKQFYEQGRKSEDRAEQNRCSQYYGKFATLWFLLAVYSDHPGSNCTTDQLIYMQQDAQARNKPDITHSQQISIKDLYAFLAVTVQMGHNHKPSMKLYWTNVGRQQVPLKHRYIPTRLASSCPRRLCNFSCWVMAQKFQISGTW
jgi:hypothetical protein